MVQELIFFEFVWPKCPQHIICVISELVIVDM